MISLDDQFKYDFTELNILIIAMYSFGIFLALFITKLIKQAIKDQEQEDALEFMVRQAEQFGLYEFEANGKLDYKSEQQGDTFK
jgi:hypothetical protein